MLVFKRVEDEKVMIGGVDGGVAAFPLTKGEADLLLAAIDRSELLDDPVGDAVKAVRDRLESWRPSPIIVTLVEGAAKLGFEAPRLIGVHRGEVFDSINRDARAATTPNHQMPAPAGA